METILLEQGIYENILRKLGCFHTADCTRVDAKDAEALDIAREFHGVGVTNG